MSLAIASSGGADSIKDNDKIDLGEFALKALSSISSLASDVGKVALKALASLALIATSSILTITVYVMKLTRFTIITSLVLGHLTKPLHALNKVLANHAFSPLKKWTEVLGKENERIIETEKVISIENKKIYFHIGNYKKCLIDSFKAIFAPVSLGLIVTNAVLWVAVKPLWLGVILPGFVAEGLITIPIALNKGIGHLTYAPLQSISDTMLENHWNYTDVVTRALFDD